MGLADYFWEGLKEKRTMSRKSEADDMLLRRQAALDTIKQKNDTSAEIIKSGGYAPASPVNRDTVGQAVSNYAQRKGMGLPEGNPAVINMGGQRYEQGIPGALQQETAVQTAIKNLALLKDPRFTQGQVGNKGFEMKTPTEKTVTPKNPPATYRPPEYITDMQAAMEAINKGADKEKVYRRLSSVYPQYSNDVQRIIYPNVKGNAIDFGALSE
jgi:hypothetical protein